MVKVLRKRASLLLIDFVQNIVAYFLKKLTLNLMIEDVIGYNQLEYLFSSQDQVQ